VNQRDKASQIAAIYYWFKPRFTYLYDPIQNELVKTPQRIVTEIGQKGKACGDCDDATCFFLAAFRSIGIQCQPVRVRFQAGGDYSHILTVAWDQHGRKLYVDPVASYKTPKMLGDAQVLKVGV
jgi:transglutaminase-like putative cysteine protease